MEVDQQKTFKSTMTSQEAADYIGISVNTLRKYVHENGLPFLCLPGRKKWLFKKKFIDEWLEINSKPITYVYDRPSQLFEENQIDQKVKKAGYGQLRILEP